MVLPVQWWPPERLRFGTSVRIGSSFEETVRNVQEAEKSGFSSIWYTDHHMIFGEAFEIWTLLGALAARTEHIFFGQSVTEPLRRSPATTAHALVTLDNISNGRALLGIGCGEQRTTVPFGIAWEHPYPKLSEALRVIKLLLGSSPQNLVSFGGKFFQLKDAFLSLKSVQKPHPPLYVAALSPKTLELVGELADGWLPNVAPPELYTENLRAVQASAKKAGRSLDEIDAIAVLLTAVAGDREAAWRIVEKETRSFLVRNCGPFLRRIGIEVPEEMSVTHLRVTGGSAKKMDEVGSRIPRDIVERSAIFGTADDCIGGIEKFIQLGAKSIQVMMPHNFARPDVELTLKTYRDKIIPYFTA